MFGSSFVSRLALPSCLLFHLLIQQCLLKTASSPVDGEIDVISIGGRSWGQRLERSVKEATHQTAKQGGTIWAVLVAGSNGYFNYRHQADICHAYHLLVSKGVPENQIIVMMYDDIAYSDENPFPGEVINRPHGRNLYPGVPIHYSGEDVTPQNFLGVLEGNDSLPIVLESGPNDHVFVNFADHGAPGLIAFPNDVLLAQDLIKTIKKMVNQKKFKQMVLYVEACESGSMFDNLLKKNWNVYATTAANPTESSYACYYDGERDTYLGDLYSVSWMEDSDSENITSETLRQQYEIIKGETNMSHVMRYGNLGISDETVAEFQGDYEGAKLLPRLNQTRDAVKSEEVPIIVLERRIKKEVARNQPEKASQLEMRLQRIMKNRRLLSHIFKMIVQHVERTGNQQLIETILVSRKKINRRNCYEKSVRQFSKNCFNPAKNWYVLRHLYVFVNLCESGFRFSQISQAIVDSCHNLPPLSENII